MNTASWLGACVSVRTSEPTTVFRLFVVKSGKENAQVPTVDGTGIGGGRHDGSVQQARRTRGSAGKQLLDEHDRDWPTLGRSPEEKEVNMP